MWHHFFLFIFTERCVISWMKSKILFLLQINLLHSKETTFPYILWFTSDAVKGIFSFISQMPYRPRNSANEEPWVKAKIKATTKTRAVLYFPKTHLWGQNRIYGSLFVLLKFHNNCVLHATKHWSNNRSSVVRHWTNFTRLNSHRYCIINNVEVKCDW